MKIGNSHSNILNSLSKVDSKNENTTFSDAVLKIASQKTNSLKETIASISSNKFVKQAQMEHMPPPPKTPAPPAPPVPMMDETSQQPEEDNGVEEAKKGLVTALVALCGGKEQAVQYVNDCCPDENQPEELTDDAMGPSTMDNSPAMGDAPTM